MLALVCVFCVGTASRAAPTTRPASIPKIRISPDNTRFTVGDGGPTFRPWGFNYLGTHGELVEEYWHNDWKRVERDFREMKKLNANVVRIHLQFGTYLKSPREVDAVQIERLKKLLDLAADCGLYLDVTGLGCYRAKSIPDWYGKLEEAERWNVQAFWWEAIARACKDHPAVFCYCLMNEPIMGGPPSKPGEPKWVGGELGGFYFVQRLTLDAGKRTQIEIAEAWTRQLTTAIRAIDSKTPITVGVIPWALVWPTAKPVFYSPECGKHLDFTSVHFYPQKGEVEKAVKALAAYDIGKPLVVEETFPLSCTLEELDQFMKATSDRADGWIGHYFGHTIEEHRQGAQPGGAFVAPVLEFWRDQAKQQARP